MGLVKGKHAESTHRGPAPGNDVSCAVSKGVGYSSLVRPDAYFGLCYCLGLGDDFGGNGGTDVGLRFYLSRAFAMVALFEGFRPCVGQHLDRCPLLSLSTAKGFCAASGMTCRKKLVL